MTSFYADFLETLRWRPGQALVALYWQLTRRRVRARNWLHRDWHLAPNAYQHWIRLVEANDTAAMRLSDASAHTPSAPLLSILVEQDGWKTADIARLASELVAQSYPAWELLLCGNSPDKPEVADPRIRPVQIEPGLCALEQGLAEARGSHLWPIPAGARIPRTALLRWAKALRGAPETAVAYADEDRLDGRGCRTLPWLKPEWHRELLLSQDYVSGACLLAVDKARALLPLTAVQREAPLYAVILALTRDSGSRVTKICGIQSHCPAADPGQGQDARLKVLADHLGGAAAAVEAGPFGSHVVLWPLPAGPAPLVSIIVPTKDKASLVLACVESVLAKTTWPAYEILIVDNNSEEAETFACFEALARDSRVRVLTDPRPYNFSAINNSAVEQAAGRFLCLLNNDTEVITGDWLDRMMRHAARAHVGAVGARLLYPDRTIQHAGVVIGMGNAAGHAHRGQAYDDPGYFAQAHVTREATAVTAACLVVDRRKYEAVGGLDERSFAIAYNDVDLCLKLRQAGLTNMYVPAAELFHYESVSRGDDLSPTHRERYMAELRALQHRWQTETCIDPMHHAFLDRATENYSLSFNASPLP